MVGGARGQGGIPVDRSRNYCHFSRMASLEYIKGRECVSCTLCCKVFAITELDKPRGQWCDHCDVGAGCKIYPDRPPSCQSFVCGYLVWPMLGDHWFPARSKLIVANELDGNRVAVHVDPGKPMAWRDEPFYCEIKQMAHFAARDMKQVVVCVGKRAIVILPDEDVDLGDLGDDDRIVVAEMQTPLGLKPKAFKIHKDDPRLLGMKDGVIYR